MKFKYLIILPYFLFPVWGMGQNRYDIIIEEIMSDPSPQVGLPNYEWLELKNISNLPINLLNWRLSDAANQSGPMAGFILQPDSVVMVCSNGAAPYLSAFGPVIAVTGFPSLDNDGDLIFLKSANGKTIHGVNYSPDWYRNELKKDGGWSLEMIDTKNPCSGGMNWNASTDPSGGTPGKKNSVAAVNNDTDAPQLLRSFSIDPVTIELIFSEPIDSLTGAVSGNYILDKGLVVAGVSVVPPLFDHVQIKLLSPMAIHTEYTITVTQIKDCRNNSLGGVNKTRTGIPSDPLKGDIVINEILFNPRANAFDFVEFYNKSGKILDASKLFIANRNNSGGVSSIKSLTNIPFYLFPGDYIVVTEQADNLSLQYLVKDRDRVVTISSLPSFPDEEGFVVGLNSQGIVVDEVPYRSSWHFKLIDNPEGVSLERIDPNGLSDDPLNWHSAASTAGFGTPGYRNSQFKMVNEIQATIEVLPKIFSPDNDGRDDVCSVQYKVREPGFVANIIVFDAAGRPVRNLVRNAILGVSGYWNWDGLNEKGTRLPSGAYIIYSELFNLQGKQKNFKNVVVLAN